MSFINTAR